MQTRNLLLLLCQVTCVQLCTRLEQLEIQKYTKKNPTPFHLTKKKNNQKGRIIDTCKRHSSWRRYQESHESEQPHFGSRRYVHFVFALSTLNGKTCIEYDDFTWCILWLLPWRFFLNLVYYFLDYFVILGFSKFKTFICSHSGAIWWYCNVETNFYSRSSESVHSFAWQNWSQSKFNSNVLCCFLIYYL